MAEKEKLQKTEVETLTSDMVEAFSNEQGGNIKQIIHDQEERDAEFDQKPQQKSTNLTFLVASVVFFALAFGLVYLVYLFRNEILTVEVKPIYTPIIFIDQTEFKDISELKKEQIAQVVSEETKTTEIKKDGIEGLYLLEKKKVLGFRKFLELTEMNLNIAKNEFIFDNFLVGIVNKDSRNLFFLIKARSTADIFNPMRAWESKMFLDLHGFFGIELNADTKYLLEKDFEDGIVQNKNARILRDTDGKVVMMYVFVEDGSLVIADRETTIQALIPRIASSEIKK